MVYRQSLISSPFQGADDQNNGAIILFECSWTDYYEILVRSGILFPRLGAEVSACQRFGNYKTSPHMAEE